MEIEKKLEEIDKKMELLLERTASSDKEIRENGEVNAKLVLRRIQYLQKESQDRMFTEYLKKLENEAEGQQEILKKISDNVERAYSKYKQRMKDAASGQYLQEPQTVTLPVQTQYIRPVMNAYTNAPEKKVKEGNVEFKIGAGVLGVIGALFLLVAFVTFGLNFLTGIVQGICLFGISLLILAVSELVIGRWHKRFSLVLTGLGICSLYLSIIINYLYLHTINGIIAMILSVVVAGSAFLLSRKKDSGMIRIISFVGCYICFFPIEGFQSELDFIIVTAILFIVNMVSIFFPVKKSENLIHHIHMGCNTVFTLILSVSAWMSGIESQYVIIFVITSVIILNTVFWKQKKTKSNSIFFSIELFVCAVLIAAATGEMGQRLIAAMLCFAVSTFFFILSNEYREKWIQYYYFLIVVLSGSIIHGSSREILIVTLIAFIMVKITSHIKETKILNGIITVTAMLVGFVCYREWLSWFYVAAFAAACFRIKENKYFYEICSTLFFGIYFILKFTTAVYIPLCMAILVILLLLFHYWPQWKDTDNRGYNYFNLSCMGILYLILPFSQNYISYTVMLALGLIVSVFIINEKYGIRVKSRQMVTALFLTYMAFVYDFDMPVIVSIVLMVIAIICVGAGFIFREKSVRRYGLILSLFVCAKLVLYDFLEVASVQRIILFLVVGIITLVISFLYIYLEKSLQQNKQEAFQNHQGDV